MSDDAQPRLPLDLPDPVARGRRRRKLRSAPRSRRGEKTLTLVQTPMLERCARCGNRQTVFGQAAICDRCTGVIFRSDHEEE